MFTQEVYQNYDQGCPIVCDCDAVVGFENLIPGAVQEIPNPAHVAWQSRHYYCPRCQNVLVYDRGDGGPLELVRGTKLPPDYSI